MIVKWFMRLMPFRYNFLRKARGPLFDTLISQECIVPNFDEYWALLLKMILNFRLWFLLICYYIPLDIGSLFEQTLPKETLCQNWAKLSQWFWSRRWKCEMLTDRQTNRRRTTGDQKYSLKRTVQMILKGND